MLEAKPRSGRARAGGDAPASTQRTAALAALAAVPGATTVSSQAVAERIGVTEHWIIKRVGVRERRIAPPEQRLWELATEAGAKALERAPIDASALDLILVATCTHDQIMPAAAALVSARLGAPQAGTMDVNAVCNGFLSALGLGAAAIEAGRGDHVLVIGADVLSRWIDPDDRRTAPVFGDGAGAVVLTPAPARARIGAHVSHTDGECAHLIQCWRDGTMEMAGEETYRHAVNRLSEVTTEVADREGVELTEVDLFVYHQANARILAAVGQRLSLEPSRVVNAITFTGNTTAASIPLALSAADEAGRLEPGSIVIAAGFGSGFSYGATLMEFAR